MVNVIRNHPTDDFSLQLRGGNMTQCGGAVQTPKELLHPDTMPVQ